MSINRNKKIKYLKWFTLRKSPRNERGIYRKDLKVFPDVLLTSLMFDKPRTTKELERHVNAFISLECVTYGVKAPKYRIGKAGLCFVALEMAKSQANSRNKLFYRVPKKGSDRGSSSPSRVQESKTVGT